MSEEIIAVDELIAFIEDNQFLCEETPVPPTPGTGMKKFIPFYPKWRQYSDIPGTEIIIKEGTDKAELTYVAIEDETGEVNTEVTIKVKVDAKTFSVKANTRYSIELPPELEKYWPRDGLDEGGAVFYTPGGRNVFAGECFWTNRDKTPWHLIFVFAEHGEWEKNHPIDLAAVGSWKLRASITYRIKL